MNKKRIEIISKYFTPANAGIEVNILETYKILAKNWHVTMHTSTNTLKEINVLKENDQIEGIDVKRYRYRFLGYFPQIDWKRADVICFHNFNVFFFPILVYIGLNKIFDRKKFIVTVTPHGGFNPEWSVFPLPQRVLKYLYHRFIGTFLLNNVVDYIRAVSEWEKQSMISMGVHKDKIKVISNGLEHEAFKNVDKLATDDMKKKVKQYGQYIIQVGRIYPIKNYETVIDALPHIPSYVNYVIVGEEEKNNHYGNYKNELIARAKKLKVSDRLIFTGQIKGVDKYYLMKHALAMVHMAIWESFCNVVHEGMSQGLVCIVANNTALPLLIKNGINGYCVPTKDSAKLAEKINFVLANRNYKKIREIRITNRNSSRDVTWEKVAQKMSRLYKGNI